MPISSNNLILKILVTNQFVSMIDSLNSTAVIFLYSPLVATHITYVSTFQPNNKGTTIQVATEFTTKLHYYSIMEEVLALINSITIDSSELLSAIQTACKNLIYFRRTYYNIYYKSSNDGIVNWKLSYSVDGIGVFNHATRSTNFTSIYNYPNSIKTNQTATAADIITYFNNIWNGYLNWRLEANNVLTMQGYTCHSSCHDNCYDRSRR